MGHARTPWTVKFHPQDATLLCSGCIGGEVRLWSLPTGRCLRAATLDLPVISLAFHSGGNGSCGSSSAASGGEPQHLLAIATFHSLYLWPYARLDQPYHEWQSARLLRCVLFPPGGHSILLGLGNDSGPPRPPPPPPPPPSQQGGQQEGGGGVGVNAPSYQLPPPRPGPKAFHLFLWAFDADKALVPRAARPPPAPARPTAAYGRDRNPAPPAYASPLSRPRPVLERALLYNDGGVDLGVGPGGEAFLVACAELVPSDVPPPAEGEEQVQPPPQQQQQQHWPLRPYLVTVALPSVVEEEEGEGEGTKDEAEEEEEEEEAPAWATEEASEQQQQHQQQQQESPRRLLPPVLAARPLDGVPPGGVTSVKLSGSGRLVLLGYGVRDSYGAAAPHPVLDVFDASKGLAPVTTVRTRVDEDVNIARFHPFSAQGFLYGTKQGRLRVFMPGGSGECRVRRGPGLVDAHDDDEEEEEEEEEENENV